MIRQVAVLIEGLVSEPSELNVMKEFAEAIARVVEHTPYNAYVKVIELERP